MTKKLLNSQYGQEVSPFSKASIVVTQPTVQWALGAVSADLKQVGHEADQLHLVSRNNISFPLYVFMACTGQSLPSLL
jgi:hypothetical protein